MRVQRPALLIGMVFASLGSASGARADDAIVTCATAYEQAQRERAAGHLRSAREEAIRCARVECPAVIRRDCVDWLEAIEAATPSIVVRAIGPDGCDTSGVLRVDGAEVSGGLEGRPLSLDPGAHELELSVPGHAPATQRIVAAQGERARVVTLSLAPPGAGCGGVAAAPPAPPPPAAAPAPDVDRPVPTVTWVLGGVALASFGAAAGFGAWGLSGRSDLDACSPACTEDAIDDVRARFLVGDVFLGVGAAATVGALVTYLVRPEADRAPAVQAGAALLPNGGFAAVKGAF